MRFGSQLVLLSTFSLIVTGAFAATYEYRTFDPQMNRFYAGLLPNDLGVTGAICGIQLTQTTNCWGKLTAYVKETTPGGKVICGALLAAKTAGQSVQYQLDVTVPNQCEIVRVDY